MPVRLMLCLILMTGLFFTAGLFGAMAAGRVLDSGVMTYLMRTSIDDSDYDILVMDVRTRIAHNLTRDPSSDFNFAWSPDGTRLAFLSNRDGTTGIYLMDADGRNLARMGNGLNPTALTWSPDGRALAVVAGRRSSPREIFTILLRDHTIYNVSNSPEMDDSAVIGSPYGTRLLMVQEAYRLYTVQSDGSRRRYLDDIAQGSWPVWSPDGTQIAYLRPDTSLMIFTLEDDSLLNLPTDAAQPPLVWLPNGDIAYLIEQAGQKTIHLLNLETGATDDYPTGLERLHDMVASPDGTMLLISAGMPWSASGQDIYLLTLSDGQMSRLTQPPDFYRGARWRPE